MKAHRYALIHLRIDSFITHHHIYSFTHLRLDSRCLSEYQHTSWENIRIPKNQVMFLTIVYINDKFCIYKCNVEANDEGFG